MNNSKKPIGTIVAHEFKCKAADCSHWNNQIGQGMSDMLVTALQQSGCFDVYEREVLDEVQQELSMEGNVGARPKLKGADFILTGSVNAFEYDESGSGGGGGLIIPVPIFGGVGVKMNGSQADIGLDLRLIQVNNAKVLVSKSMEGKAGRSSFGIGGGAFFGAAVGGWFESHKNTPIEEAVRDVLSQGLVSIMDGLKQQGFANDPVPTGSSGAGFNQGNGYALPNGR